MDCVKLKLDCEEWTSYSNIENKSGKIECPECKNHEIDTKLCLEMLVNKEIIKRKLIELSFEDILEANYSAEIDNQFDVTINKIDLECESVIKQINDYRDSLLKKLNEKKMDLINQMEKLNLKIVKKDNFQSEIDKEKKIQKKIQIENKYETLIADFKSSRDDLEKEIKQNKHELKVPNDRLKLVQELIGKLDLVSVPNEPKNHPFQTEKDYSNQTNILISKEMVQTLIYGNEKQQLNVTHHFRKLMSKGSKPPIDQVINTGIVPKFVEFLQRNNHQLQIDATWILTNIASGNSVQTRCVIEAGALPILVQLLSSSSKNVQEKVVWALGNIAGDSPQCRDLVLDHGILPPLLDILSQQVHLNLTRSAVWCLSNLCQGKNSSVELSKVESALPILATLLSNPDVNVLTDATWAIAYLSDGFEEKIQKIIDMGVCPRLVELLKHSSHDVVQAALRAVGNIVTGNDLQIQIILDANALQNLLPLLNSSKQSIKKEVCLIISNITAGTKAQIQMVFEANIFPKLIELMCTDETKIRKEAVWAVVNAASSGTAEQIRHLVELKIIQPLCDLLELGDTNIVQRALNGVNNILNIGQMDANLSGSDNLYSLKVQEYGGWEKIKFLQFDQEKIYKQAFEVIEKYLDQKNDEHMVGSLSNTIN